MSRLRAPALLAGGSATALVIAYWALSPGARPRDPPRPRPPLSESRTAAPTPSPRPARAVAPPSPSPSNSAPEQAPMIDIPADPPPDDAGSELERSGLPRPLFDAMSELALIAPEPPRLDAAERRLGRPIPKERRDELIDEFRRTYDDAAQSVGYFRLGQLPEPAAVSAVERAEEGYRRKATALLGVTDEELSALFKPGD